MLFSLQDVVFQWLMTENIHLNQIDAEDPEVSLRLLQDNVHFDFFKAIFVYLFHWTVLKDLIQGITTII